MYIQHESTNWGHNLNVSYWRRNRHFTWSSEPREGLAVYRAKRQCLHFSDIWRSWVLVRPHESSPLPPALQSSALLTEQILPRLKCHRNAICFKSTMSKKLIRNSMDFETKTNDAGITWFGKIWTPFIPVSGTTNDGFLLNTLKTFFRLSRVLLGF